MKQFLMILIVALTFVGCEDFIGGDINTDPNNPLTVPVDAQLPAFQIALADVYGGQFSRFNSMLTQQVEGVARQWASFNQYTGLTPNRFDDSWTNIYENVLNEIQIARAYSTERELNHYNGLLNVVEAFTLMASTDVWDDMPYSDAFKGLESSNPAFDTQADIYVNINRMLTDGIALLEGAPGSVTPGDDDVFYGGDIAAWIKAAKAVRARGKLHLGDYSGAMADAMASFESPADNMAFQYPDANNAGQWYRFNRDRTGDLEFHPTMRALLSDANDTLRLAVMDQTFVTGHTYLVPNFNQEMITYREMQFIIAEADFRDGNSSSQAGYDAMINGIKASFTRLGLTEADYDSFVAGGTLPATPGDVTLEDIMTQKYIAMFLQPEVYSDYRRTDFPTLTPVSGTVVPVRWHYGSDEYLFNSNSPSEGDVNIYTDKVGWDN